MAKSGIELKNLNKMIGEEGQSWALCIGAGTSSPLLPDWFTLVDNIVHNFCDKKDVIEKDKLKQMGFSADAMLQAIKNHLILDDDNFMNIISDEVYDPIKNCVTKNQWNAFCKISNMNNIPGITPSIWSDFIEIRNGVLNKITANQLAQVVIKSIQKNREPASILTFNGEDVFFALLQSYYQEANIGNTSKFDKIVNGISYHDTNRIPYIHCHGVIPIKGEKPIRGKIASDKLIYSEVDYLQIANNAFSWQSSSFIDACLHNKVVFVGVSMTDSNMRRWLSWLHSNKINELKVNGLRADCTTEHYWINKKKNTKQEMHWCEEAVAHLGVRVIWIDDWSEAGLALEKMIGL